MARVKGGFKKGWPVTKKPNVAQSKKAAPVFEQDSEGSDAGSLPSDTGSEQSDEPTNSDEEDEDDDEEERPKYAAFMDNSDLEEDDDSDSEASQSDAQDQDSSSDAGSDDDDEDDLKAQMQNIPLGALMEARQQLNDSGSEEGSFSEPDISDLEEDEFAQDRKRLASQAKTGKQRSRSDGDESLEQKRQEVRERLRQLSSSAGPSTSSTANAWAARKERKQHERRELAKRTNKNAPTEISSKRPVSRRRNVVDVPSSTSVRDPRFESLSGSVNKDLFSKSYSFLPELFSSELSTLKATLAKLKKAEATQAGPKAKSEAALAIREERAKVEAALRRAEGLAGERERRAREDSVKGKIKRENKERVEQGKLPFYPKKREVKQLVLKDKYDRLAGGKEGERVGGKERGQLKKALERRRRKNAQKEKKSLPAGIGFGEGGVPKRKRMEGNGGGEGGKRAKF